MKDYKDVEGWLFDEEAELLQKYADAYFILELGVYKGKSSLAINEATTRDTIHFAVDTFDGRATTDIKDTYKEFIQNTLHTNIKPIMMTTTEFSKICPIGIDLLFIDAEHTYEAVKEDFENYINKVDIYKIIIFHDAYGENGPNSETIPWPGVYNFCQELQKDDRVELVESVRRCAVFRRIK